MQTEYFRTSREHILAELERIDLLIQFQLMQTRKPDHYGDGFEGHDGRGLTVDEFRTALDNMAAEIWLRKAESKRRNIRLRLDELSVLFELTPLEYDTFLICLAPELNPLYERIYAYFQDDVTKTQPDVRIVSKLLYPLISAKLDARKFFSVNSSLCKNFLLHFLNDPLHQHRLLASKCLKVDERIVNHLLDLETIDTNLLPHVRRTTYNYKLKDVSLPVDLKHRLACMVREREGCRRETIVHFKGPYGAGKRSAAEAICNDLDLGLLFVDLESMLRDDRLGFEKALRLVLREATLQQAALYWQGFDLLLSEGSQAYRNALLSKLEKHRGLTFLSGERTWEPLYAMNDRAFACIEFPGREHAERFDSWPEFSDIGSHKLSVPDLVGIAHASHLIGDQVPKAADKTVYL